MDHNERVDCNYRYPVCRYIDSSGAAELRLPAHEFYSQYRASFAVRGLDLIASGTSTEELQGELETYELDERALSLAEWFEGSRPSPHNWDGSLGQLKQLAVTAHDLQSNHGVWRDEFKELALTVRKDAVSDLVQRMSRASQGLNQRHGHAGVRQLRSELFRRFQTQRDQVAQELAVLEADGWSNSESEQLLVAGQRLERFSRHPSGLLRIFSKLRPNARVTWLMNSSQRRQAARAVGRINDAAEVRYQMMFLDAQLDTLDEILGTGTKQGALDRVTKVADDTERFFNLLKAALESQTPPKPQAKVTKLLLADNINTTVDPTSGRTFRDVYDERVARAGCTLQDWAKKLWTEGLRIEDRLCLPHQWPDHHVGTVVESINVSLDEYFGAKKEDPQIDIFHPQAGFEHFAAVTLLDVELRILLTDKLEELARRSKPRITHEPIVGAPAVDLAFMWCFPAHRRKWQKLLQNRVEITDDGNDSAYELPSPYEVKVLQSALAIPPGAVKEFKRWIAVSNEALAKHKLSDSEFRKVQAMEQRLLKSRVKSNEDCRQLFAAAKKAALVCHVGNNGHFILSKPDPRFLDVFATITLDPEWHDAGYFFEQLNNGPQFEEFVQREFSNLQNFAEIAEYLRAENDAIRVADELVNVGVLRRNGTAQYCVTQLPSIASAYRPPRLYSQKVGAIRGLTHDEFVAQLGHDDDLYNVAFWSVLDAFQLGHLSKNDVPASILEMDEQG